MNESRLTNAPSRGQIIAAFAAVYLIWGSTYLGIRIAIETMPPFLMAGIRLFTAGVLLYVWMRWRGGAPRPTRQNWLAAAAVGGLMLLGGNGLLTWAEQRVPSGLAALLVAMVPLWMVLLDWLRPGGTRPGTQVFVGLAFGLLGVGLLVSQKDSGNQATVDLLGALVVMVASFLWAAGSLYSRSAPLAKTPLLATGMEMLAGGALLLLAGTLTGEWSRLNLSAVSLRSLLALGYLIVFGSLVAFSAYVWLLRVTTAARVSTYAYVNPAVAIFLGWALAGEPLSAQTAIAAAIIVAAVVIITTYRARVSTPPQREEIPCPDTPIKVLSESSASR